MTAEDRAARQVALEAWRVLSGGDPMDPSDKCAECGLGGVGALRDALRAFHAARCEPIPRDKADLAAWAERTLVASDRDDVPAADPALPT